MFHDDSYYQLNHHAWIIGSCNGLLLGCSSTHTNQDKWLWLYFWNPAMRTKSKMFEISCYRNHHLNFSFGYDNSTRSYKLVAVHVEAKRGSNPKIVVKVFSSRERFWRDIHCLPVRPLYCFGRYKNNGLHLNGTINWICIHDRMIYNSVSVDKFVILSLNLSTETYTQLLPPPGFDKVHECHRPRLAVLMDYLCFYHDFESTHFVIWQMKDFGVQDTWIQLFKISYQNFFKWWDLLPLYLYEDGDTMVLTNGNKAFIYNRRDNTTVVIGNSHSILWSQANDYVESLVSTH